MATPKTEFWLSGPIEGIIPVLQPAAHAILQAQREIREVTTGFTDEDLWKKPGGVASVGFHLQHIAGVLDRLFTYARGQQLSAAQLEYLKSEGKEDPSLTVNALLNQLDRQISASLEFLRTIQDDTVVLETRFVGRKQIPSNVLGLLFHAAEHTQRHTGQLLVTARVINR